MEILERISKAVIEGNSELVKERVDAAIKDSLDPGVIINKGLISGMAHIGERFKKNEVYVPEVLIAARAMHAGMDILQPLVSDSQVSNENIILIGTVKGDLHDIGKNLVIMMLEGAGYKVIDLGVDVPETDFLKAVDEYNPKVVGLSALLTTTMPAMQQALEAIKGHNEKVLVLVGGAPVTQDYADSIGADGYAPDAATAVDRVKELLI